MKYSAFRFFLFTDNVVAQEERITLLSLSSWYIFDLTTSHPIRNIFVKLGIDWDETLTVPAFNSFRMITAYKSVYGKYMKEDMYVTFQRPQLFVFLMTYYSIKRRLPSLYQNPDTFQVVVTCSNRVTIHNILEMSAATSDW